MKKIQFYIIIFFTLFIFTKTINSAEIDIYKKIDLFGEVLEKINKEYVGEINQSESMDSAINGLLQSLDPYSAYMSPEILNSSPSFDGHAVDLWAVGVILFMMLTGLNPWAMARDTDAQFKYMSDGYLEQILTEWDMGLSHDAMVNIFVRILMLRFIRQYNFT